MSTTGVGSAGDGHAPTPPRRRATESPPSRASRLVLNVSSGLFDAPESPSREAPTPRVVNGLGSDHVNQRGGATALQHERHAPFLSPRDQESARVNQHQRHQQTTHHGSTSLADVLSPTDPSCLRAGSCPVAVTPGLGSGVQQHLQQQQQQRHQKMQQHMPHHTPKPPSSATPGATGNHFGSSPSQPPSRSPRMLFATPAPLAEGGAGALAGDTDHAMASLPMRHGRAGPQTATQAQLDPTEEVVGADRTEEFPAPKSQAPRGGDGHENGQEPLEAKSVSLHLLSHSSNAAAYLDGGGAGHRGDSGETSLSHSYLIGHPQRFGPPPPQIGVAGSYAEEGVPTSGLAGPVVAQCPPPPPRIDTLTTLRTPGGVMFQEQAAGQPAIPTPPSTAPCPESRAARSPSLMSDVWGGSGVAGGLFEHFSELDGSMPAEVSTHAASTFSASLQSLQGSTTGPVLAESRFTRLRLPAAGRAVSVPATSASAAKTEHRTTSFPSQSMQQQVPVVTTVRHPSLSLGTPTVATTTAPETGGAQRMMASSLPTARDAEPIGRRGGRAGGKTNARRQQMSASLSCAKDATSSPRFQRIVRELDSATVRAQSRHHQRQPSVPTSECGAGVAGAGIRAAGGVGQFSPVPRSESSTEDLNGRRRHAALVLRVRSAISRSVGDDDEVDEVEEACAKSAACRLLSQDTTLVSSSPLLSNSAVRPPSTTRTESLEDLERSFYDDFAQYDDASNSVAPANQYPHDDCRVERGIVHTRPGFGAVDADSAVTEEASSSAGLTDLSANCSPTPARPLDPLDASFDIRPSGRDRQCESHQKQQQRQEHQYQHQQKHSRPCAVGMGSGAPTSTPHHPLANAVVDPTMPDGCDLSAARAHVVSTLAHNGGGGVDTRAIFETDSTAAESDVTALEDRSIADGMAHFHFDVGGGGACEWSTGSLDGGSTSDAERKPDGHVGHGMNLLGDVQSVGSAAASREDHLDEAPPAQVLTQNEAAPTESVDKAEGAGIPRADGDLLLREHSACPPVCGITSNEESDAAPAPTATTQRGPQHTARSEPSDYAVAEEAAQRRQQALPFDALPHGHLSFMTVTTLKFTPRSGAELKAVVHAAPELTSLDVSGAAAVPGGAFGCLMWARSLESLDVSRTSFGDGGAAAVATLPGLQRLDVSWTRVRRGGTRHLLQCPPLVSLEADGVEVDPAVSTAIEDRLWAQFE